MLIKTSITTNFQSVTARMNNAAQNQVPFAVATALTRTAKRVEDAEVHEMRDVFDRPTPYTLTSFYTRPARKDKLEASVQIKDFAGKGIPASKFLSPQIYGGDRNLKRFEAALVYAGVLPPGYFAVPGEAAKLDPWGNMDRGQIVQVLSYFRAFPEVGYRANMTDKRRASLAKGSRRTYGVVYFLPRPGDGLEPGVWMREVHGLGSRIRPVLIFVRRPQYEPLFDFHYVAEKTASNNLPGEFDKAMAEAARTAR